MHALIAFDKFKDALDAFETCQIVADELQRLQPDWHLMLAPLADGGDGFCQTLTRISGGSFVSVPVTGPLEATTTATYGLVETQTLSPAAAQMLQLPSSAERLAIVELAQSSGIALVPYEDRNPWVTNTSGLGETIAHATQNGADSILVGLGGSSTQDLALGALQALGFQFNDKNGKTISCIPTPRTWPDIESIAAPNAPYPTPIRIACDVENPLLGPNGAAAIFGPQKGMKPEDFDSLDRLTQKMASLLTAACPATAAPFSTAGAGAAGGAAYGLMVGLGGLIVPGAELVFAWSDLSPKLKKADLILTGEGRFDASSLQGKGPGSLVRKAKDQGKPAYVFAGSLGPLPDDAQTGMTSVAISPPEMPLPQAIASTRENLAASIRAAFPRR